MLLNLRPAVVFLASWAGDDLDVALASLDPHVALVAEAVAEPLDDHGGFDEADAGFGAPPDEHGALGEADGGFGD